MERVIILYGNSILRMKSNSIKCVTDDLENLALDMIEIVKSQNAVGLSAIQLGEAVQLLIMKTNDGYVPFFNPCIKETSKEILKDKEGCLSLPGIVCEIPRHGWIEIEYLDVENEQKKAILTELESRIFQHEMDHLNGKLMIDYLTPARLSPIKRKLKDITKLNKIIQRYSKG